jgi:L-alanine-DL-glutamate epimerase-like enolase superfamily enzyme
VAVFQDSSEVVETVDVEAYTIPTDAPESDGTLSWTVTTLVMVKVNGGGQNGIGYSYTHAAAAELTRDLRARTVRGMKVFDVPAAWEALRRAVRNLGRPGVVSSAIAADETAIRDLKACLLELLDASAVDVLQADATRCGGYLGSLEAATLCEAPAVPLSAHTAPLLHLHVGCAAPRLLHAEYFHDHAGVERLAFDGAPEPENGRLRPDLTRPGLGVEPKRVDLDEYRVA